MNIETKIIEMVKSKIDASINITPEMKLHEMEIDSLIYIEIVVEIEAEFKFQFEDEKLSYEEFNTLRDIIEYVESQKKGN